LKGIRVRLTVCALLFAALIGLGIVAQSVSNAQSVTQTKDHLGVIHQPQNVQTPSAKFGQN